MEIEISGLNFGLLFIAIGLGCMGYFIGKGLQNFRQPEKVSGYYMFIKEDDLEFYLNLNRNELQELLNKHPEIPNIILNGVKYYPKKQLMEWLSSNELYNK